MSTSFSFELDQVTFPWEPVAFAHRCNLHKLLFTDYWAINFSQYGHQFEDGSSEVTKFRYSGSVCYYRDELFGLIHVDMIHHYLVGFVILSTEPIQEKNPLCIPPTNPQSMSTMCLSTICNNWQLLQHCARDQLPNKMIEDIEIHKNLHRDRIIQDVFTSHQAKLVQLEQETGLYVEILLNPPREMIRQINRNSEEYKRNATHVFQCI